MSDYIDYDLPLDDKIYIMVENDKPIKVVYEGDTVIHYGDGVYTIIKNPITLSMTQEMMDDCIKQAQEYALSLRGENPPKSGNGGSDRCLHCGAKMDGGNNNA